MAASILFACGLNEQQLPPNVHISEESNVDGSFLISCILGQRLRISNAGVLLVCLQHSFKHYFNAGMRLGYNANIFIGKTLQVIDPPNEMAKDWLESEWLLDTAVRSNGENRICDKLLTSIREQLSTNFTNRINTTILIDNLSILLNLGASTEAVIQFCYELAKLSKEHENLSIITKMNNCDIYSQLDNNMAKLAGVRIRVNRLKSGMFREVDGKLWIERDVETDTPYPEESTKKEILYKVNDRNVKIFNPGEIGVKV